MSSTWRTVASPKALSFSSGTYCATLAFSSSLPSATRICPIRPKNDLVTDMRDVLAVRPQRAGVALVHDAALVQHHDAVGEVGVEGLGPGHGLGLAQRGEGHRVEVGRARRAAAAPARPAPRETLVVGPSWRAVGEGPAELGEGVEASRRRSG